MTASPGPSRAPRKVCVVLVDRANYGRLKPVMHAIQSHADLELQVLAAGTMVLERFQQPVKVLRADGFTVDGEIYMELEGSTPTTMAKSVGFGIVEFTNEYQRLRPDVVVIIGDRYEALSAAVAAAFMNLCLIHIQGGEVSGSIDESTRHAISKFAHYHFPSTERSSQNLIRMGERPETILGIGCPSGDIAKATDLQFDGAVINRQGSGAEIDATTPYMLVVFHPTTTEFGGERQQIEELLAALDRLKKPTVLLWPNIDAGSDHISKAIRVYREHAKPNWLRLRTNFPPQDYLQVLGRAACAVGNSSSFVRDASFFGTPVVLVGNRQQGREWDRHVQPVPAERVAIEQAIQQQLKHGPYPPSTLYGDGHASERIAAAIARLEPYTQKRLHFSESPAPVGARR